MEENDVGQLLGYIEVTIDRKEVMAKEHGCHRIDEDTMHDHAQVCINTLLRMHGGMITLLNCMTMPKPENTS